MKKLTLILSMMIALIGLNANAAIYIVGDEPFGGWSYNGGTEMTDNQDGSYSITATISGSVWFVFADGRGTSWDEFNGTYRFGPTGGDETVEVGNEYTTQRGNNGAYKFTGTGDDYVITFNPTTLKFNISGYVAPIEVTTYNVVGDFNGWDVNADEMTLVNGVYTLTKQNVEINKGNFLYKFVGNHDYGIFEYPTGMNNLSEPVDKHGYYDFTITFVPATLEYSCTLTLIQEIEDPIIEEHTYTVAGDNDALFGSYWDQTDTNNDMTLVNGLYTWTKKNVTLTAGTIPFKVVMDHDWNNGANAWPADNYLANIESNGDYDVKITFNEETKEITFEATPVVITEDFYVVAGAPAAIFGQEWAPGYAANNMTLVEGLYTWTKDSVDLATTTKIEFKVVKNGNWANPSYPADNYEYYAPEDGVYNLVITYNPENDAVLLTANKLGGEEPPVEMVYTAVGPEAVFGSDWDATDTNNDMVLDPETGLYTWTADSVELTTAGFGFKVVGNHTWDNEWPQGYGNNWIVNIAENGTYNLVITFNAETGEINCVATLVEGGEPTEITVYTVVGPEAIFGSDWDATDENNDMTLAEGVYTWNKENVELNGTFGFKVVGNHDYAIYEYPMGFDNNWIAYVEEPGIYNIAITFDPEAADSARIACTLTKVEAIEMVYTVAGPEAIFGSDWDVTDTNNDMVLDETTGLYTWTKNGVDVAESFGFKVVGNHTWDNEWPQGYDNNWIVNIDEAGKYDLVITFNAATGEINCVATKVVEPEWEVGDVNHSKSIDIEDVTMLINAVLGNPTSNYFPEQANCNGQGGVDIEDVTALISRVLNGNW